jgi:hypothetical protein
MDRLVRGKY